MQRTPFLFSFSFHKKRVLRIDIPIVGCLLRFILADLSIVSIELSQKVLIYISQFASHVCFCAVETDPVQNVDWI